MVFPSLIFGHSKLGIPFTLVQKGYDSQQHHISPMVPGGRYFIEMIHQMAAMVPNILKGYVIYQ